MLKDYAVAVKDSSGGKKAPVQPVRMFEFSAPGVPPRGNDPAKSSIPPPRGASSFAFNQHAHWPPHRLTACGGHQLAGDGSAGMSSAGSLSHNS
ncbi:MAG TPA: hypothetical protein PLD21_01530, partial [Rhodocyclaceae bacterium]|nr:hypothetical protein [Rhodocyclaceae bacterium]